MAGPLFFHFPGGDVGTDLLHLNADVAAFRRIHPVVHEGRFGAAQGDAVAQPGQVAPFLADNGLQGPFPDFQIVAGGDFLGLGQIVAGLGFVGVGDGHRAHFKAFFGQGQLLADGRFLGQDGAQVFLGVEHVEIGLGRAQNQILLGLQKLGLGLGHLELGLVVLHLALPAEQGLGEGQGVAVVVVAVILGGGRIVDGHIHVVVPGPGPQGDIGQQGREALGFRFPVGVQGGLGAGELGIVVLGFPVDLGQVGGGSGLTPQQQGQGEGRQADFHKGLNRWGRRDPLRRTTRACPRPD